MICLRQQLRGRDLEGISAVCQTVPISGEKMQDWARNAVTTAFPEKQGERLCGFRTSAVEAVGNHDHGTVCVQTTLLMVVFRHIM